MVMTYIDTQHAIVAQWVALRPIFEVCTGKTGYEGGGCRRDAWWYQGDYDKNLGQPWNKFRGKQRVGDSGKGEPHSDQGKVEK